MHSSERGESEEDRKYTLRACVDTRATHGEQVNIYLAAEIPGIDDIKRHIL